MMTIFDIITSRAFGVVLPEFGIRLNGQAIKDPVLGTFVNIDGHKGFLVATDHGPWFEEWPEWGIGVFMHVTTNFIRNTSRTVTMTTEEGQSKADFLADCLLRESRGRYIFEAVGILGGIWAPGGGLGNMKKALDE